MKQAETFPHDGITHPCESSRLLFGEARHIAPQGVHEQGFRKLGEHRFAADSPRSGFFDQVQNGILQPESGGIRPDVYLKNRWQAC